jgi:hypothetical protein
MRRAATRGVMIGEKRSSMEQGRKTTIIMNAIHWYSSHAAFIAVGV